jgi:16S rRNA pseudouridine516 synthase
MFAAAGNHVETLHRAAFGPFTLSGLPEGEWRLLNDDEVASLA